MIRYKHAQFGWVMVFGLLGVEAIILIAAFFNHEIEHLKENLLSGAFIILLCLFLFYNLRTVVSNEWVSVSFGVGLIRKTIPLENIQNCVVVRNKFIIGWGIRFGLGFIMWNVSGFDAVELTLKDKSWKFRIGTDQPQELHDAILAAITARSLSEKAD